MLKKISVRQLTVGMYLKAFCGSWLEHPFLRNSFVITDPKDIERILASSIEEVWIDSSQGLDIPPDEPVISEARTESQVDAELVAESQAARVIAPASIRQEMARASKICAQAKQAVTSMFQEARMGKTVDADSARQLVEEISDSVTRNPSALISIARLKTADNYTYMHSVAVCALMTALGRQLKLDDKLNHTLGIAGLLHDLGKAMIPNEILNKPGKLTDEEFRIMKTHSEEGYKLLRENGSGVDPIVFDVVLHHHEKIDGTGYPQGSRANDLSLYARMGAICDVYDAITSNRSYKPGWDPAESLRKMAEWTKGHLDPGIFQAFVKSMGIYPIGSLVRLNSGRLGVITDQSKSLLSPRVKVFFSTHSNAHIRPELVDLSAPHCAEKIVNREDPAQWNFPDFDTLWATADAA